jgi:acyl-CoA synthetase (AMP-forming)/AMP-acid ligase II
VLVPVPGSTIDVRAVQAYLRERIADFKVPEYVVVRTDLLPRNPGGKLLKRRLREETQWGSPVR